MGRILMTNHLRYEFGPDFPLTEIGWKVIVYFCNRFLHYNIIRIIKST